MRQLFSEYSKEKWEEVRHSDYYRPAVEEITKKAERYLASDPAPLKYRDYELYYRNGNRSIYGGAVSQYDDRLSVFAFMYMLTEEDKYLSALSDAIWWECDMESWTPPAHMSEDYPPERRETCIDLCSSIMGSRIAEILALVGDKLPKLVRRRAEYEVRKRVIDSFHKYDDFPWIRRTNNWASVCAGSVGLTYLYMASDEEIEKELPRLLETMRLFLTGFDKQGCCYEGYAYWKYGFSFYVKFAKALYEYSKGKIDLFDNEKVHAIAKFQENMAMNDRECVSFSDCDQDFTQDIWLSHVLKKRYPDIEIPPVGDGVRSGCAVLHTILLQDPALANEKMTGKNFYYEEAQWFIHKNKNYNFAAKAGSNNESHNHNDVGSFLISKNGKVTFTDPGREEYNGATFGPKRYEVPVYSSYGHSVPLINGKTQKAGTGYAKVTEVSEHVFAFDFEGNYDIPELSRLNRRFECGENELKIIDTYEFNDMPDSICERFSTYIKPEVTDGCVKVGDSVLSYDPDQFSAEVTTYEVYQSASRRPTLYFIELRAKAPKKNFSCTFTIS